MSAPLRGVRVGFIERQHPPGHRGAIAGRLVPLLRDSGARVEVVHAEPGLHRLDEKPPWDLVVLKSGSAAALHLAAAAEGWGIPSVNPSEATRLAQDKLASAAILQRAGLPIAPAHLAWLGPGIAGPEAPAGWSPSPAHRITASGHRLLEGLETLSERPLLVKAARSSQGTGLWPVGPGELTSTAGSLPEGPYLLMQAVPHAGDDLKVFVAGDWMAAIERPFPATNFEAKLGRPAGVPESAASVARRAGRLLGLTCFGCDFVRGRDGWVLVDTNAFPGYKGASGAPEALALEISRFAEEVLR